MGLSPQELISRRAFDDAVIRSMLPSQILHAEAYKTQDDLRAGRPATAQDAAAGKALYYAVWYDFPILIGPAKTTNQAVAVFNTNVPDFPFRTPEAYIVSKPLPWSPHFHPQSGLICQGDAWARSRGNMLLAHAIVHVARLLNCDEKDRDPMYVGWNSAAITYWRRTMNSKPLNEGLPYPIPSVEVTHGISSRPPLPQFQLVDDEQRDADDFGFKFVGPAEDGFQLVGGY